MISEKQKLKDFCVKITKGTTPSTYGFPFVESGINYIKAESILEGGGILPNTFAFVDEATHEYLKRSILCSKDILISIAGAKLGKCGFLTEQYLPANTNQAVGIVRVNHERVDPKFIYYNFVSAHTYQIINSLNSQAAQPNLNLGQLGELEFLIPSLPTQRKIASILSAYDDLIENNLKRIKLLEEQAFLKYKGILTTERLEKISVFDYAHIMSGGTPSTTNPNFWEGEIPFFTPKDLSSQSSYYLNDTERKLTELGLEKCNSKLFPRDTIFITARGTVGKLVLSKIPSAISQSNYAITTRNGSSNYFLFLALIDKVNHFKQLAVGGVFDTIIVDTFKMIFIEIPSKRIIDQFNIDIKPIFQLIDTLQKQNTKLREARDILLPKLMNGQIEV